MPTAEDLDDPMGYAERRADADAGSPPTWTPRSRRCWTSGRTSAGPPAGPPARATRLTCRRRAGGAAPPVPAPIARQDALRAGYLAHLAAHPDGIWRDGPPAHLTASCFVLDQRAERVLLTLHRKGGLLGAARRPPRARRHARWPRGACARAREESGLPGCGCCRPGTPPRSDLHRHALSGAFGRCREHLDVAFAALADGGSRPEASTESLDVAWWPVTALPEGVVPDLPAAGRRGGGRARRDLVRPALRSDGRSAPGRAAPLVHAVVRLVLLLVPRVVEQTDTGVQARGRRHALEVAASALGARVGLSRPRTPGRAGARAGARARAAARSRVPTTACRGPVS